MTYTIRQATKDEAALAANLGRRTFTETFGHMYSAEDLTLFLTKSHSPKVYERLIENACSTVFFVETVDHKIVGYASLGPCGLPVPDMPESAGELQRFYLLKDHQGGGVGSRLLTAALEWLEARFKIVYLSVYSENFGAMRLYERYGFKKIHAYHYMVGNQADPEFIMEKKG